MNPHQTPTEFYSTGYPGTLNRSPSSSRPGFSGAPGMPSAMNAGRRGQQQLEPIGQAGLFADDRYHAFDSTARFDAGRSTQTTLQGGGYAFGGANQAAWGMNHGGAATMNGPLNDGTRMRNRNVRAALPSAWTSNDLGQPNQSATGTAFYPTQHLPTDLGLSGGGMHGHYGAMMPPESSQYQGSDMRAYGGDPKLDSELIPTAIVIKNIPFNIRKEFLTATMVEANLPQPYAFNYHFDQGVFRGLAFANFQSAQDTEAVIQYMNGLEIGGRKLRVEYKKMLPEHERERIEREKREKRGQLEEQHRAPTHQLSMNSLAAAAAARQERLYDLNDPHTLKYYIQLYMFRNEESNKETLIFPSETSPEDRRLIHTLAHNMGLEHTSMGEGENRQIHVSKSKFSPSRQTTSHLQHPGLSLDAHPKGLSRAATYDFNERHHLPLMPSRQTLAVPGSPDGQHGPNGILRGVKSFADLRSFSPSPSPSVVSNQNNLPGANMNYLSQFANDVPFGPTLTNPTTLGGGMNTASAPADSTGLVAGMNSLGLGGSPYDMGNTHLGRGRDAPGAIGSQRPSASSLRPRDNPERQPRGPTSDWENAGGFNTRGRANGHMTRGSDSSDPGRLAPLSGSSIPHQ